MKSRRLKEGAGRCRSKQHKEAYIALKKAFPVYRLYNEYPYVKIVKNKSMGGNLRADIYIKDLEIVIEIQGEQHYTPVAFGGSPQEAEVAHKRQIVHDYNKRYLAEEYEFYLVELPHYTPTPNGIEWLSIISDVRIGEHTLTKIEQDDNGRYVTIPIDLEGNELGEDT